ncbi:transglutaminase-like enzyme, predicted cysteine protease [Methylophilaceae bacterium 11]|uniref:transglutaminase family protein n=1 Tax=Methylotenera sp. N17 TaxID=1502761 RepID=UPI000453A550|nr:transglutaminase family protein [Methylotenera sp. N17]EUJ10349.1 transglutaminase-like enzyme, predicted cysteine protease [Methylophilaceae bacterium 11]
MRYHVLHETEYHYDSVVTLSQQMLHMTPRNSNAQYCEQYSLIISPTPTEHTQYFDYFKNYSDYIAVFTPHELLKVSSSFTVSLQRRPYWTELQNSLPWETVAQQLLHPSNVDLEVVGYLYSSPNVKSSQALMDFALLSFWQGRPLIEAALDLTQRIYQSFEFDPEATNVSTPLDEVLAGKRGVCQDFAHLMIGCLRSLGLASRYVSGYILTNPPEGKERLVGADASHAWVSVYCPTYGWIDFDPTNNCLVQSEHITVAWGRDFSDVSPMRGVVLGGGAQELTVRVTVTPVPLMAMT